MGWRYYVQRPGTGLWLDVDATLADVELTWALSGPNSGKASVPPGLEPNPYASDGMTKYGKYNTLVYAEEDGNLSWVGIVASAKPSDAGLVLEFIGAAGWLQRVPFTGLISSWKPNVFDVIRALIRDSYTKKPGFEFVMPATKSAYTVGDIKPPAKPKKPVRRKGQSASAWQATTAYKNYQKATEAWNKNYASNKPFEIGYWEAPYIGEEIDSLVKETGIDYREGVKWVDKARLKAGFTFDFADDLRSRRGDIEFIDGVNLAKKLDPKDRAEEYAQHIIALGAGEGRAMKKAEAGTTISDTHLYQAMYVNYKSISDTTRLRALALADYKFYSNTSPQIDSLAVWDVAGFASTKTLRCGDEVRTTSANVAPPVDTYVRILSITRTPGTMVTLVDVETVG